MVSTSTLLLWSQILAEWIVTVSSDGLPIEPRVAGGNLDDYCESMVLADIDIWRSANLLLRRHGKDAAIVAAQRADECMSKGDVEGLRVWKRIAEAMLELLKEKPEEGERLN